jgi:hypothetical protein
MRPSRILLVVLGALVVFAGFAIEEGRARAQRYGYYRAHPPRARVGVVVFPRGVYFGGGLVGTRILHQKGGDELLQDGVGLTLYSGLRANRSLALELGWVGSLHNPSRVETAFGADTDYLVLNAFTADAKIYVPSSSPKMEPFLQGGLGVYFLDSEYFGTQSVGSGFQLGGGFDFHTGSNVTLGLRALYRGMAMGPPAEDYNDTFVSAATIEGNLTFWF